MAGQFHPGRFPGQIMKRMALLFVTVGIVGAAMLATQPAFAVLGGTVNSITADQRVLAGKTAEAAMSAGAGYSVSEITTPTGVQVREYVSPDGIVFAVTWRGAYPPDLSQLLGSYFAKYQTAAEHGPVAVRHSTIKTDDLIVERGGHPRDLWGRAIAPALVPAGVNESEIQ
ncbi:MAG: DUF2844 domain-containing protein [Candidatus Binataceae bacterium]